MNNYEQVVDFINKSFQGKNIKHFERAVHWLQELLKRELTEAEKIAAYSHDIERAFRENDNKGKKPDESYLDTEFLTYHQTRGAEIMNEFLKSINYNTEDIKTVVHLISKHEVGGDKMQDILMNADSLSFFETNAEKFAIEKVKIEGYSKVKDKLDWMYNRINLEDAKNIAKPLYEKWSKVLETNR